MFSRVIEREHRPEMGFKNVSKWVDGSSKKTTGIVSVSLLIAKVFTQYVLAFAYYLLLRHLSGIRILILKQ